MSTEFREILLRLAYHIDADDIEFTLIEEGSFQDPQTKIKITNRRNGEFRVVDQLSPEQIYNLVRTK